MDGAHDISHAISLHPRPSFHIQHDSERRPSPSQQGASRSGATTALEHNDVRRPDHDSINRRNTPTPSGEDLEQQENARYSDASDPYHLSSKIKTSSEIQTIRTGISRRNSLVASLKLNKTATKAHQVYNFYNDQNETIARLLKPVDEHRRQAREEGNKNALKIKIAIRASFVFNTILAIAQTAAAIKAGSKSLYATMLDAICDPLSNMILLICMRKAKRVDPRMYPQGKARIEPSGNIMFCGLMILTLVVLIWESAKDLIVTSQVKRGDDPGDGFDDVAIIIVACAAVTKLLLFLYCCSVRHKDSQVLILWKDHRNDLFVNVIGIATSVLGEKVCWWVDPFGAIVLSLGIIFIWGKTAWAEFRLLVGVSAEPDMLQHITYIAITHSPGVVAIDTVRAWHSGPRLIVEVDIVMNAEDTLRETHDVAEALQTKLENLPNVDRAYVHVDYETTHAPEHFLKKEL